MPLENTTTRPKWIYISELGEKGKRIGLIVGVIANWLGFVADKRQRCSTEGDELEDKLLPVDETPEICCFIYKLRLVYERHL